MGDAGEVGAVGFTTLLTGPLGSFVAKEPAPILALLPIGADSGDYVVSERARSRVRRSARMVMPAPGRRRRDAMAAVVPEVRRWRLAAIVAAGVVASSRPMAEDEGATVPRRGGP